MKNGHNDRAFYRFWFTTVVMCLLLGFAALYFLVEAVEAISKPEPTISVVVVDLVLMCPFLVPAVRYPWHGVVATSEGIRIRNILKTHVLRWDEIDHFELTRHDPWPRVGVAILREGRRVPMTGIQAVPYERAPITKFATRAVAALNERLVTVVGHGRQTEPSGKP